MDTVALCGGCLDDRHGWMLDGVDIHTTWSVLRGLPNRSQASVCGQLDDGRTSLPFPLARVLACAEVSEATKARLRTEQAALNPFAVRREVDRQMKGIEAARRPPEP